MILHTVLNNKSEIYSDWLKENIINLNDSSFKIPNSYQYEIIEVNERYIARPDILSKDIYGVSNGILVTYPYIYGDSIYADLLCKLNGISNPFELNKGMLMIIPSPDTIMEFMNIPTTFELDSYEKINKPVGKTKKSKRKANDAIIGDSRFKIDKNKGIVIY